MKTKQIILKSVSEIDTELGVINNIQPDLILVFGALSFFYTQHLSNALRKLAPNATIAGCSTAGEISVDRVYDDTCVISCINFEKTRVLSRSTPLKGMNDSFDAGARLAKKLPISELSAVIVFGLGVNINGSGLVSGLQSALPQHISIFGGLAAGAGAFKQTWTVGSEGSTDNHIVVVGLYGSHIHLSCGYFAGWQPIGPARKVTKSVQNILYELDGEVALDIYKRYLRDYAKDLPAAGLLFPFEMLNKDQEKSGIFRTILNVNESDGSLTLAGDIDPNSYLKLMHTNTEKLISGAETAAERVTASLAKNMTGESLAILISCVSRKLVMGDRVGEEVEAVAEMLGKDVSVTGFYSNGEIAGNQFLGDYQLHNQTMTISYISET
jgi:hypothetical protein